MLWNNVKNTFGVNFRVLDQPTTKRGMLKVFAPVYDPVSNISPVMLIAKVMYSKACNLKLSWD